MSKYKKYLIGFFSRKGPLEPGLEDKNYFEIGLIDSLDVIILIEELEKEFEISFNETHFQDRRFSTINGLAHIIQEIKKQS